MSAAPEPIFFSSPEQLRAWLEEHHASATELLVGHHKAHTGKPSLTFEQLVREALCFGWIDGQVRTIDQDRYQRRLTPRRPRSRWSAVNVRHVEQLEAAGLMREAGRRAYAARDASVEPYSLSARPDRLPEPWESRLRADPGAAAFWEAVRPSYRKQASFWVTDAKREATREQRFAELAAACARGERLARFG